MVCYLIVSFAFRISRVATGSLQIQFSHRRLPWIKIDLVTSCNDLIRHSVRSLVWCVLIPINVNVCRHFLLRPPICWLETRRCRRCGVRGHIMLRVWRYRLFCRFKSSGLVTVQLFDQSFPFYFSIAFSFAFYDEYIHNGTWQFSNRLGMMFRLVTICNGLWNDPWPNRWYIRSKSAATLLGCSSSSSSMATGFGVSFCEGPSRYDEACTSVAIGRVGSSRLRRFTIGNPDIPDQN